MLLRVFHATFSSMGWIVSNLLACLHSRSALVLLSTICPSSRLVPIIPRPSYVVGTRTSCNTPGEVLCKQRWEEEPHPWSADHVPFDHFTILPTILPTILFMYFRSVENFSHVVMQYIQHHGLCSMFLHMYMLYKICLACCFKTTLNLCETSWKAVIVLLCA